MNLKLNLDDFKQLDPKNIGNWPVLPKIVTLIVLLVGIVAAGWVFDWDNQLANIKKDEEKEAQLKDEFKLKKQQAINLDLHRQQLRDIDQQFGALLKQLPDKSQMEALLVDINQAGLGRGLQFELFKPGTELKKDFYAELPIAVRITGNYHDIGTFASDLAQLSRIVTLNDVKIMTQKEGMPLAMDATVRTFRYLDDSELAASRKAAVDAKKKPGGA